MQRNGGAEVGDFHRVWGTARQWNGDYLHTRSTSISPRSDTTPPSTDLELSPLLYTPLLSEMQRDNTTTAVDDAARKSPAMLQPLGGSVQSVWPLPAAPPVPPRATGHTAVAAAAAIAAIEEEEAALARGDPSAPSHASQTVPPLLCATLSDLSFKLDGTLWFDSTPDPLDIFPAIDFSAADGGEDVPLLFRARSLRRLSSSFSDWKRFEPPHKK